MTNSQKILELWSKPVEYKFSAEELSLIAKYQPKSKYRVLYGFYRKESKYGAYIVFIIDQIAHSPRRSGIENNWEYISERPISKIEWEEMIANFGYDTRRFNVWYYQTIDFLINEDRKYGVETPQKFVDECRKRGYSGAYQPKLEFELQHFEIDQKLN